MLFCSSDYWEKRWNRTGQYLFAKKLVKDDILNARYRYGMEIDEKMVVFVQGLFPKEFSFDQFWGAVASDTDQIYNGYWSNNLGLGREFRKHALLKLFLDCEDYDNREKIRKELMEYGLRSPTEIPKLPPMEKIELKIKDTKDTIGDF